MKYKSFHPGQPWLDTNGKRIHAHGGSIFYENGRYYWYGENKEKTTGLDSIWHWGIRCYVSGDLYNWDDLGLIIPPEPDDPASTLHPSKCVDRPHILYNRKTGKYVCWLKVMSVGCTVLTADALLGPYTVVHEGLWPLGMEPGDFDLAVAPDGKAYYFFERVHSELICADLTDDYTNVTGYYLSAIRYGRKPVCAAYRCAANICTKRYGRKTASFPFGRCLPFCTDPRYRRNWCAAAATGQPAEYASARYGRNAAHVHRRTLYPAGAANDARFCEWHHPDHAAESCFCAAVQRRGAADQRNPHGWSLHNSGASGSRSAVFQPRSWYASALDHTA